MDTLMKIFEFVSANYQAMLSALIAILTGVIGICMMIPGSEPENTLQKIVDFLSKFSKK